MPAIAQRYEPAWPIDQLTEHPDNPRRGDEAVIEDSMAAHGFYGAVLVQASSGQIIAGNHRTRVAQRRGETTIPAIFLDVDDEQARRILLVDNRSSDQATMAQEELAQLLAELAASDGGLAGTGYDDGDLALLLAELEEAEGDNPGPPTQSLADMFIAPPFSVLDGRAGYWRERKRRWLNWGIRSVEGRADNLLNFSDTVRMGAYSGGDAWGWSGTSIFDPVLTEILLRWFCPPNGRVCDPFCGGSVRGAVASALGHPYAGYDLRQEQIDANELQGMELALDPLPDWRVGDAREARWDGPYDMLLTCPPYWHLERYSDEPADLSTAETAEEFGEALTACLRPAVAGMADDTFCVMVLGAMRNGRHELIDLPGIGMRAFADCGLLPYNDLVLLTPLASAALRAQRNFALRKPTPVHQRIVIAVKGDPERAVQRCGPVDVLTDEEALAAWLDEP